METKAIRKTEKTTTQTVTVIEAQFTDAETLAWLKEGWTLTITKGGKCLTRVKSIVIPTI